MKVLTSGVAIRDYLPVLKWLILTSVTLFGLAVAWYLGAMDLMIRSDKSRISLVILALYAVFSAHCLWQTIKIARDTNHGHRIREKVTNGDTRFVLDGTRVALSDGTHLADCTVTNHIRNLLTLSQRQGAERVDQTLLLRSLADTLRQRQHVGWFVADTMIKLGLLGTVIGFIYMLLSINTIDSFDTESLKLALGSMSGGMGVALFTTLFGLVGGVLLKLQYYFLDQGTSYLFSMIIEFTEVYVVSVLNWRSSDGRVQPVQT